MPCPCRDTELGKKQAARAAEDAARAAAATAIQAAVRRRLAQKKVRRGACSAVHASHMAGPLCLSLQQLARSAHHMLSCLLSPCLPFQAAQLRREAAKLRELQQQRDGLAAEREELRAALAAATQRAERAEGEVATLRVGLDGWGWKLARGRLLPAFSAALTRNTAAAET